jgi:hypothetical protein
MEKLTLLIFGIIAILIGGFVFAIMSSDNSAYGQEVTMYKSPNCGCCVGHGKYLNGKGFDVKTVANDASLQTVKEQNNIPNNMRSCHTDFIEGYFIEGHVPIEAINKLLEERPNIDGISLPNMPSGSPGMPGFKQGDWIIYSIKDGQASEFMRI